MGDAATDNRTFKLFKLTRPVVMGNRHWNWHGEAYYRRRAEEAQARDESAFWVQQRTANGMNQVRVEYRAGQNLIGYLTRWELLHSNLFPGSNRSVEPIIDENGTLIAHMGWFAASQILIPKGIGATRLDVHLAAGYPAYVNETNPMPAHYDTANVGKPEMKYCVLTDPEGQVLGVCGYDYGSGAESTTPPWEYVMMGKALITLVSTGGRVAVKALVRNLTKQSVATGPTVQAAEKALLAAERNALKSAEKDAAEEAATAAAKAEVTAAKLPAQLKKVTTRDMLEWEKQGGHTLQNHNPTLTRQNLRARIIGKEEIPAPQIAKGGTRGPDLRVWQGERAVAASKFASEDVMHRSISDVINNNLAQIRAVTSKGGKIALERQSVGYITGEGWITTAGKAGASSVKAGESAMFYGEKLTGVSIYLEPTTANAEGWFVRTAFPEMIE